MAQTQTIPDPDSTRAASLAEGLRRAADIIEAQPWLAEERVSADVPVEVLVIIEQPEDVRVLADLMDATVDDNTVDQHRHVSVSLTYGLTRLRVASLMTENRSLRRRHDATAALAERDV